MVGREAVTWLWEYPHVVANFAKDGNEFYSYSFKICQLFLFSQFRNMTFATVSIYLNLTLLKKQKNLSDYSDSVGS